MAIATDQSNLFNFVQFIAWNGQYSGSHGVQNFDSTFSTITYNPTVKTEVFNSIELVTSGYNTYYKLQGYNTTTNEYEVWYSTGKPNLIPPSGNLLSNIEVVLAWVDR